MCTLKLIYSFYLYFLSVCLNIIYLHLITFSVFFFHKAFLLDESKKCLDSIYVKKRVVCAFISATNMLLNSFCPEKLCGYNFKQHFVLLYFIIKTLFTIILLIHSNNHLIKIGRSRNISTFSTLSFHFQ